ncbi:MAG: hypothetical protein EOM37_03735 [Proteobacteria bacterium]|jgi:hypothetical protein|nr:hypothetical protein [Alphaproteobacteria bacterium]NCC03148.1 hypothetical protein [Pseudomonadota bacterium]
MQIEELSSRYGAYLSEMVRQSLTLEEFSRLEIEELVAYFELMAERSYEEYRSRKDMLPPENGPLSSKDEYLQILRRRWQQAEEMAYAVMTAEKNYADGQNRAMEA